ncbi:MAG: RNA polymerase factor sigma-54 [Prevotella sp.]|nr:RNA polymerase factor sigma-54 [Candidatus Prevotella equi]
MELSNIQQQEQQLTQQQRLRAQQVMIVRMLEMPLAQFEQNVQTELDENPALEGERGDEQEMYGDDYAMGSSDGDEAYDGDDAEMEREERADELDKVLDSIDSDDRMEQSNYERANNNDPDADQEECIYGNMESFYDKLREQMGEQSLTERQELIMEYLIGSLDSDGLLRKDLYILSDEIAVHEYIDVSVEEIEHVLNILQSFDPAGIGAQSLQQCLLIQIFRKQPTPVTKLMHTVISEYYDLFARKHWKKIAEKMGMSDYTAEEVFAEIRRLNPRPGASLGETMGRSVEQITPDFTLDISDDGEISFTLNKGRVPMLYVSHDFEEMIDTYRQNPQSMTRRDKEALVYAQQKVNRAKMYIDAIRQRQQTMIATMRALIVLQKQYLISGDESDLKPMILKDVAERSQLDISTVSRVCNSKYAETPWGTIPLKSLFSDGYDTGNGDEVSTREIKNALKELISREAKGKPLSDIKLAAEMKRLGYPIARRTVAKYREQLGIPPSNLRR